ncbi:MAG: DUF5685 family protein [Lachnospiraceae bacterium]|nr:DUF5685 family protein [Lachnospiraceae bacterium]
MFGYIYINEQELKLREYTTYRSFYCGLCQELHHRYGRRAQLVLNYDTTFLAILLTGLYEPETLFEEKRCLLHPVHKHSMAQNDAVSYAADMCVLLAYQKAQDDWEDERRLSGKTLSALLKSSYEKIAAKYPRQSKAVEENIRLLHEVEKEWLDQKEASGRPTDLDYVAGLTGNFLAELFVWKDDIWQDDLRQIGFYLGKFIYLMDALEDIEKDRKKGNYNLFSAVLTSADASGCTASGNASSGNASSGGAASSVAASANAAPDGIASDGNASGGTVSGTATPDSTAAGDAAPVSADSNLAEVIWQEPLKSEIQKVLTGMMTEASRAFERLPVLEYAPIIRNILYSGVWCKYSALQEKTGSPKSGGRWS